LSHHGKVPRVYGSDKGSLGEAHGKEGEED